MDKNNYKDVILAGYRFVYLRSPVDSILEVVFTVSPNKQYLGILCPTTPATQEPECIPIRSLRTSLGRCLILDCLIAFNKCNDIEAISPA